ncbi:MAG: DUF2142 domain-containing protein, partial [Bacteroidales bacterium]
MRRFDFFKKNIGYRCLIIVFCILAAIRVFIYSAAFPFYNNVDEWAHYDIVMKYSHGHIPKALEVILPETAVNFVMYNSPEFVTKPDEFPGKQIPQPVWKLSRKKVQPYLDKAISNIKGAPNPESTQPPLYYIVAGIWTRFGSLFGLNGVWLLYWIRFLNIILAALIVWLAYVAVLRLFPENRFIVLGVPLLAAFFPQDAFYSIQSDVLSPVCFGFAFICMIDFIRADIPNMRQGILAGLAVAATVLVKTSNIVLAVVILLMLLFKVYKLVKTRKLVSSLKSIGLLLLCIFVPLFAWYSWNFFNSGDWTGSESKIQLMGWTHKSLLLCFSHPIFTLNGLRIFWTLLINSFWHGEITWHGIQMGIPVTIYFYWISSLILVVWSLINMRHRTNTLQQNMTWLAFGSFISLVLFMVMISVSFDFGNCFYPSNFYPFFVSG